MTTGMKLRVGSVATSFERAAVVGGRSVGASILHMRGTLCTAKRSGLVTVHVMRSNHLGNRRWKALNPVHPIAHNRGPTQVGSVWT